MVLHDLVCFYLRCRFACDSVALRNFRLLWTCTDLLLPAEAALLALAAVRTKDDMHCQMIRLHQNKMSRAAADDRSRPNRIAMLTRLRRAQAFPSRRHKSHSNPRLPIKTFLLGDLKGDILFCEREYPPLSVPCAAQGTTAALSRCHIIFYSALGSFAAGFISNAQMTIARIVFGSM